MFSSLIPICKSVKKNLIWKSLKLKC
jgi:hypothetical protein